MPPEKTSSPPPSVSPHESISVSRHIETVNPRRGQDLVNRDRRKTLDAPRIVAKRNSLRPRNLSPRRLTIDFKQLPVRVEDDDDKDAREHSDEDDEVKDAYEGGGAGKDDDDEEAGGDSNSQYNASAEHGASEHDTRERMVESSVPPDSGKD